MYSMPRSASRHLGRFSLYFATVKSGILYRQEWQIVQSWLYLDDFLA